MSTPLEKASCVGCGRYKWACACATRLDPVRTPLEDLLYGKRWHHDLHCNAKRGPMGGGGCSCFYAPGRRLDADGRLR